MAKKNNTAPSESQYLMGNKEFALLPKDVSNLICSGKTPAKIDEESVTLIFLFHISKQL